MKRLLFISIFFIPLALSAQRYDQFPDGTSLDDDGSSENAWGDIASELHRMDSCGGNALTVHDPCLNETLSGVNTRLDSMITLLQPSSTTSAPKDTFVFSYSGRQYLDATWRGFSNAYGPGFYQFSQGMGTAVDPGIVRQRNGYIVPFNGTMLSLYLNGYHSDTESMDIEIDITCFSSSDNSNAVTVKWRTKFNYNSNNTFVRIFDIRINQAVAQGDEIMVSMRKPAGGTRRYFYHNATMYFEK